MQVGSQVSGNISWLGADFNSIVKQGQVIARLDPSLFQAQMRSVRGEPAQGAGRRGASRRRRRPQSRRSSSTRSRSTRGRRSWPRNSSCRSRTSTRRRLAVDYGASRRCNRRLPRRTPRRPSVVQAQASREPERRSTSITCTINAPIDGIVIQRSVDVGQTVAASMQAPTLFIIAADLTKMQVNANIDEADVGRIRPRQNVTFRVDAYPGEEFQGSVAQIRLQPVVVQNVTTYATIINVPNPQLKLKPGMTANLRVQIARRADVLRVPNAALRFRPTAEMFAALNQPVPAEAPGRPRRARRRRRGRPWRRRPRRAPPAATPAPQHRLRQRPTRGARPRLQRRRTSRRRRRERRRRPRSRRAAAALPAVRRVRPGGSVRARRRIRRRRTTVAIARRGCSSAESACRLTNRSSSSRA